MLGSLNATSPNETIRMDQTEIFNHQDLQGYLNALLEDKKRKNSLFSIRAWAKLLNYNSAAYLGQVLKSERNANITLIKRIREAETLDERQWRHLKLLFLKSHHQEIEDPLFTDLLQLNKPHAVHNISLDAFDIISEWYYFTIVESVKIKNFRLSVDSLKQVLVNKLEDSQLREALKLLVRSDFLEFKDDVYKKTIDGVGHIFSKVPNKAINLYHRSMLSLAKKALQEQTIDERHFGASTFAIKKELLEEARKIIDRAHEKIQDLSSEEADYVYQFNTQLFKMTESPPPKNI